MLMGGVIKGEPLVEGVNTAPPFAPFDRPPSPMLLPDEIIAELFPFPFAAAAAADRDPLVEIVPPLLEVGVLARVLGLAEDDAGLSVLAIDAGLMVDGISLMVAMEEEELVLGLGADDEVVVVLNVN